MGDTCAHACLEQPFLSIVPTCFIWGSSYFPFPYYVLEISGSVSGGFSEKWCSPCKIWDENPFPSEEKKKISAFIDICTSFCMWLWWFFFLLPSSHSLMKMLNKTGLCRGPQGPNTRYFLSGVIAVYHDLFFPNHSSAVFNSCDSAPMQVNLN